ncbi:MAG: tRNA (N6-isopentenyl adenosine(37)-C2)-methylthiotransferase MiaB [Acidobacteria bacterium]|nr:tRNA (N6-isopentenyl adenosine(37)-C2)-methylthiotransferase MiaB [Acidobacteriota bacterium]
MAKRYFIETFGCQMNVLDSEKIAGSLQHVGMERADILSHADVIILNTCSVREKAVQKVYARLGELKHLANGREDLLIGVVGCMPQLEGESILKRAPFVNILAGPQKGHVIGDLVQRSNGNGKRIIDLRKDEDPSPLETVYIRRDNPWRAGVTISEGCNRRCTFCVVPITRGNDRARDSASIIHEAEDLIARGYVEIVLLGQTVNSYVDRVRHVNFAQLLRQLAGITGLRRIRFVSPHPSDFSDELLDVMVAFPQVCNQIHLPVQSGSTRILAKMRRGYTRERYLEIIRKIKNAPRNIAISTDIIVGFPGESEADFQDTLTLMDEVQYDSAFSFKYSPRPHTEAINFPDEISEKEKGRRLDIVQEKQKLIQYEMNASYIGKNVEVLVDGKAKSRVRLAGRMTNNKIVNFDGPEALFGRFVQVNITGFSSNSLKGNWIHS